MSIDYSSSDLNEIINNMLENSYKYYIVIINHKAYAYICNTWTTVR